MFGQRKIFEFFFRGTVMMFFTLIKIINVLKSFEKRLDNEVHVNIKLKGYVFCECCEVEGRRKDGEDGKRKM